jgi:2-(1,2-epoxy-1,2-dihydrophenyl)acetyl-CoA isomerase
MAVVSTNFEQWSTQGEQTEHGDIVTLSLEHPKSAVDRQGLEELLEIVEILGNSGVEVLVFDGGPEAFCTGMDIATLGDLVDSTATNDPSRRQQIDEFTRLFHASIIALRKASQPVIGAIDGAAAGGGLSIALTMDLAYATPGSTYTHAYTDIAGTSDGGATYFLPRLVGLQRAKELVFSRQPIQAEEMANLGLVNEVVPADRLAEVVREKALELAAQPSAAIADVKQLLQSGVEQSLEMQLEAERDSMKRAIQSEEFEQRINDSLGD